MGELKTVTLLEGLLTNDSDLQTYSKKCFVGRFGSSVTSLVLEAYRNRDRIPDVLIDQDCSKIWKDLKSPFYMSVPAIMDFYRNGPKSLSANIKEQLILSHRNFIYYIMKHYFSPFMPLYSEDLCSCGIVGLLKAMHEYNGQNAFTTYSKYFIIHEMADFTYFLQGNPSCYYAKIQKQIRNAIEDGCDPDVNEIVYRTGIKRDIVVRELGAIRASEFVCLDEYPTLRDTIIDEQESIEEIVENRVILSILKKAIQCLDEEERELLVMRFGKNYSLARIAREKGVCYSRARKQCNEILDKLRHVFF